MYLGGYWHTEKYNNYDIENLRKVFTFKLSIDDKNREVLGRIISEECSVIVQIRLGDYIGSILDVTTPKYFYNAKETNK